jgi:probable HAF family extracellular repeat protein
MTRRQHYTACLSFALALGLVSPAQSQERRYTLTDLGTGSVIAIAKDSLLAVGNTQQPPDEQQIATIFSPTRQVIGTLPGGHFSLAHGAHGQTTVGESEIASGEGHAFRHTQADGMVDLGTAGGVARSSVAASVAAHDISGFGDNATATAQVPLVWVNGTHVLELPTLGGPDGAVAAVNDAGINVGSSQIASGEPHATLWLPDGSLFDLHPPEVGGVSFAMDINAVDAVTGFVTYTLSTFPKGFTYGFVWSPQNGLSWLAPLIGDTVSLAFSLNSAGDVVGDSFLPANCACEDLHTAAVLWPLGALSPVDLNTLVTNGAGWHLIVARGINEAGQIVGVGFKDGVLHSWLLTPVIPPASARHNARLRMVNR